MGPHNDEQFCFTEICGQVQAANIFLRLCDIPLHVLIQPNKILTQSIDGQASVYNLRMNVDPLSCSSISHKVNQGIGLRFQIQSKKDPICLKNSVKSIYDSKDIFKGRNIFQCSCRCKSCGISLLSEPKATYTRVLPLPSSSDNDLSDSWACCDHTRLDDPCNKSSSQAEKFYQDEFHFAFHHNAVCRSNLRMTSNMLGEDKTGIIQCGRCYSVLGEITSLAGHLDRYCLFYKCNVTLEIFVKDPPRPIVHSSTMLEDLLCEEVIHNVKSKEIYKFVICDKRKMPIVLMQVLNLNGCLGYYGFDPSRCEELLSLKSVLTMCGGATNELLESFPHSMNTGKHICEHLSRDNSRVIKLLYTIATNGVGQMLSETWLEDPNVKILTLPYAACMETFLLLTESTLILPLRHMAPNGFLSGFLSVVEQHAGN